MGNRRRGRPPKPKNAGGIEPIAPAAWDRIRRQVAAGALDPVHGSEIGRLSYLGELTATQVAAAMRIGEIYGRYERTITKRRTARSPSYDVGFRGSAGEETEGEIERAERARIAWDRLQEEIEEIDVSGRARSTIEQLCVEDIAIPSALLPDVRVFLDHFAQTAGLVTGSGRVSWSDGPKRRSQHGDGNSGWRSRHRSLASTGEEPAAAPVRRRNIDLEAFTAVLAKIAPKLEPDQIGMVHDTYRALKDRAMFRRSKRPRAKPA